MRSCKKQQAGERSFNARGGCPHCAANNPGFVGKQKRDETNKAKFNALQSSTEPTVVHFCLFICQKLEFTKGTLEISFSSFCFFCAAAERKKPVTTKDSSHFSPGLLCLQILEDHVNSSTLYHEQRNFCEGTFSSAGPKRPVDTPEKLN